jgi:hypothetical protein
MKRPFIVSRDFEENPVIIPLSFYVFSIALCFVDDAPAQAQVHEARGVVFHDRDGNGRRDEGEPGVAGVPVSNGRDVVRTDDQGRYTLAVGDDTAVFVIKPSGWQVPLKPGSHLPQHYYLHKPKGSPDLRYEGVPATGPLPASIDFPLQPQEESTRFRVVCFGDTQPRDLKEVEYISHDVIEELMGIDAAFGITLGDLVFDDLSLLEPLAERVALLGLPWHHVIGNHDENYDAKTMKHSDESYERVFGPAFYAFNYGGVHFVVLDDTYMELGQNRYHAELGERQLQFLRNDLAFVPKERLVVLMMHIPLNQVRDQDRLFEILGDRPHTLSLSAHTHTHYHVFMTNSKRKIDEPHHHIVHGTVCGGWWSGMPDERGIPHATMPDGTPNGYSIITFDENHYSLEWRAAGRPKEYQMNIYAPEAMSSSEVAKTDIMVNVFAGSERSRVEMRLKDEGAWIPMQYFVGRDPALSELKRQALAFAWSIAAERDSERMDDKALREILDSYRGFRGRRLPEPGDCRHLWKARFPETVSSGIHLIQVREVDMFGQIHQACRIIQIKDD